MPNTIGLGTITADLLNAGTKNLNCQSCHEIHVDGLHSEIVSPPNQQLGDFNFKIPHLVNMPGIQMEVVHSGDPNLSDDYEISYGVLCRTCHIK